MAQERILVVDDEAAIRTMLQKVLEYEGFEVTTAGTVAEALALISQFRYHVLISDLNMGHPADGFVVVSAMRRTNPETLTFILTGYPDFDSALEALRQNVNDYLVKATPVEELINKIKTGLATGNSRPNSAKTERVPDIVESQRDWIVEQWLQGVKGNAELMRVHLGDGERTDHVPDLLKEATGHARGADVGRERQKAAEQHGTLRYHQGYTVPMLVLETQLLQHALSTCISKHFMRLDLSHLVSDVTNISDTLMNSLCESSRAFMKQYEWNSTRTDRRSG